MNLTGLDLFHLTKLTSNQVDHVTCLECCKYYIAPETAACGHTLCHACWRGRRTCPSCASPLEKRFLKVNLPLQKLTEHVHTLAEAFEKLFNIKLDEFVLDGTTEAEEESEADPTKNVKDWLASSQNQFSAPLLNSEPFSPETNNAIELSTSKIQVHGASKKSKSPEKVVYLPPPQDDWDKIEQLPDTEEFITNNEENPSKPNQQMYFIENNEYTTNHPRRSSRKRDFNEQDSKDQDKVTGKHSSKSSSLETEKKSNKSKQNWNNVKRMRKEFSKLNKKNRSKLNVSIEMCKKAQSTIKSNIDAEQLKTVEKDSQPAAYVIEDNTPDINVIENVYPVSGNESPPHKNVSPKKVTVNKSEIITPGDTVGVVLNNNTRSKNNEIYKNSLSLSAIEQENGNNEIGDKSPKKSEQKDVQNTSKPKTSFIKKSGLYPETVTNHDSQVIKINNQSKSENSNTDDIEITIKIGNTLTHITIKKKSNDVQLRVNTDREVQTSLGPNCLTNENQDSNLVQNNNAQNIEIKIGNDNSVTATQIDTGKIKASNQLLNKSTSTKKNTASADTATAQYEITESVEKELSNIMECAGANNQDKENRKINNNLETIQSQKTDKIAGNDEEYINDLDIFDNGSVLEQHVQLFNKSKQAHSEILMPTVKNSKTQKDPEKRDRDLNNDDEMPSAKKFKAVNNDDSEIAEKSIKDSSILQPSNKDNDSINYDVVMGQVFASIDADIVRSQKSGKNKPATNNEATMKSQYSENIIQSQNIQPNLSTQKITITNANQCANEKYSENIFSITEKVDETNELVKKGNDEGSTQRHIENLLTPGMCHDLISTHEEKMETVNKEQCTPFHDHDDSDKSVVEETPQKNVSFQKPKNVSDASNITNQLQRANSSISKGASSSPLIKSVINVSDSLVDSNKTSKELTIIEAVTNKQTMETPLTINKFVNHIQHNSTPVARKSLNFDSDNIDNLDPEQTLCLTSVVAKTTQEKEFMSKAFEPTPKSPIKRPLMMRNVKDLKYCIAGSCLSPVELTHVKILCRKYNWKYLDKYTRELTHLVVGVDEENRSQRSVKYMCALAASKWIVSYEWVDACISKNMVVEESLYEALDGTGEPGPERSRLAKTKLFEGITFFCMPPFSVLNEDALTEMLVSAGGRVVSEARSARAGAAPALLLAEPEHTQEDRFMYLALELSIVPVNYEWALNCLGGYSLSSIQELLLCPAALLPKVTASWPDVLIARDSY